MGHCAPRRPRGQWSETGGVTGLCSPAQKGTAAPAATPGWLPMPACVHHTWQLQLCRSLDCPGETEGAGGGMNGKKAFTEAAFLLIPERMWRIRNALV